MDLFEYFEFFECKRFYVFVCIHSYFFFFKGEKREALCNFEAFCFVLSFVLQIRPWKVSKEIEENV